MTFMITFSLPVETIEERTSRFLETGAPPPDGVKMEGRWHSVSAARGWVVASTQDAKALRRVYEILSAGYPQSEWARRAQPYSAIPL